MTDEEREALDRLTERVSELSELLLTTTNLAERTSQRLQDVLDTNSLWDGS